MRLYLAIAPILAALVAASPVKAEDVVSMQTAIQLGSVLAAEHMCGLSFNQAAITGYVEKNIRADDMAFPSTLRSAVAGTQAEYEDLSASEKTAQCAQIARAARSYGFTK